MERQLVSLDDAERQLLLERYSELEFVDDTDGFQCVRCTQIPIIHYFTNCGHLLCFNCKRTVDNGGFTCKQCNTLITNASVQQDEFEARLLALKTKCPNYKYGCQLITNLAQIPKHIKTCKFTREVGHNPMYKESVSFWKNKEEKSPAAYQEQSNELRQMQTLLNSQMETQKKICSQMEAQKKICSQMEAQKKIQTDELRKLSVNMENIRSQIVSQIVPQMNKTTNKIMTLSDDLRRLQNGLDELNIKFDNLGDDYVLVPKKKVNLLLVGPTGVGKSTFINAFVNYLKFKSLDEAQHSALQCLIPCAFTIYESQYQTRHVKFGEENENENTGVQGQSATQKCKFHKIEINDLNLTIIDTPGFGDTRNEGQDTRNVDHIIDFVAPCDRLIIAVLLKPNENKLTAAFENCMRKLISHFYATATKEIIFIFTNSRSFFYKPGDTILPLKEILKKLQKPVLATTFEIKFNKENVFCMDNEAFRYLVALKSGVMFNDNDYDNFKKSWQKSAEECNRMIKCLKGETSASSEDHAEAHQFHQHKSRQY